MSESESEIEASYDAIAAQYAAEFEFELARKPFDRGILDRFAGDLRGRGQVCEIGCGPGHIARYLDERGVNTRGIDLSTEMVKQARHLHPHIPFERGDMRELDLPAGSLAGIICFYAIIHLRREEVVAALERMRRALAPDGRLLLAFHGGEGSFHRDEWYGKPVNVEVTLFEGAEIRRYLERAGFEVDEIVERPPYEFEYQTRRLYAFARSGAA